jgi:putative membrane protein
VRRAALASLGIATLALAWAPWTSSLLGHGFTAHMARHMAVVAVAAPLIALGVAGSRADPSRERPGLFAAIPASLVELFVVWGWHAPAAHDLARASAVAFLAEQASFLAAGLWVWIACFGYGAGTRASRTAAGMVAMLLTSIHMTLLGALLAISPRPLYAGHHAGHEPLAALAGLADQHLGGVVMLLVGGAAYLAGGVTLAARLLAEEEPQPPLLEPADVER